MPCRDAEALTGDAPTLLGAEGLGGVAHAPGPVGICSACYARIMPNHAELCRVMPSYAQLCPVMPRYGQYAQYAMLCPVMPSYADGFPKDAPGISDLPIVPKVMPAYSGWPYHAPRQDEQRQQRHVRSRQVPAQPRQPHRALLPAQPPPCRAHSITRV